MCSVINNSAADFGFCWNLVRGASRGLRNQWIDWSELTLGHIQDSATWWKALKLCQNRNFNLFPSRAAAHGKVYHG